MTSGERALLGALAGVSATMIMTMAMRRGHDILSRQESYPLPPRELTERILDRAGSVSTMLAHFGYGGLAGGLFGITARRVPAVVYGPLVWATSYLGWIPLTRRLRPATAHPGPRNVLMLLAHLIWGLCLGLFLRELTRASQTAFGPGRLEDAPEARGPR